MRSTAAVFAVLAAIGLAIGFGIAAMNQDNKLARILGLLDQSAALLQESELQNAQQDALLFELALNSTDPAPTLTVLLTGNYTFSSSNPVARRRRAERATVAPVGTVVENLAYRIVRVETPALEFVIIELDMPALAPIPIVDINQIFSWYAFDPSPALGVDGSDVFLALSKRNLEKFAVSSGCLASGECFLASDAGLDIRVNSVRVSPLASGFAYETYLVGPEPVLLGQTITFAPGPLQFPLPLF